MLLTRLRSFIRYLSVDINEQRRLCAALILLIRSRIWFLYFLSPFLSRLPYFSSSKLFLWHCLSKVYFSGDFSSISCKNLSDILVPLIRRLTPINLRLLLSNLIAMVFSSVVVIICNCLLTCKN